MDFSRVLQQSQSYLENAPKVSDATKQILDQGENFQKTMSGERGIMAAIEAAHLRPVIQKYISGKLKGLTTNDVINGARNIGTRLTGTATRGQVAGPMERALVTENKVLAKPTESGLVQEGGFQSLAPGRGIADRFGSEAAPSIAASRLTQNVDPLTNPYNPRNVENVGQSGAAPPIEAPSNLGLPGEVTPEAVAAAGAGAGAGAGAEEVAAVAPKAATTTSEELSSLPSFSPGQSLPTIKGAVPAMARAAPKPTPEPSVPSASTPAPTLTAEQSATVAPYGAVGNPLRGADAPPPPALNLPSVPTGAPGAGAAAGKSAGEEEDEQLAARLQNVQKTGVGADVEEETSSFTSMLPGLGTTLSSAAAIQSLSARGLSGGQRASGVAQSFAPQVVRQAVGKAADQFGLPKAAGGAAGPAAGPAAGAGAGVEEDAGKIAQEATDKALAEKLATQATTEGGVAGEEASVPGIGTVLAIGTALFGAIRGGVEAEKAKKAAQAYVSPTSAKVAMDNAPSFDSSFR